MKKPCNGSRRLNFILLVLINITALTVLIPEFAKAVSASPAPFSEFLENLDSDTTALYQLIYSDGRGTITKNISKSSAGEYFIRARDYEEIFKHGINVDSQYVNLFDFLKDEPENDYLYDVFADGSVVVGKISDSQKNSAIQAVLVNDRLVVRYNFVAVKEAETEYYEHEIKYMEDDSGNYSLLHSDIPTGMTITEKLVRDIERLDGKVSGVDGKTIYYSFLCKLHKEVDNSPRNIKKILTNHDNQSPNYIILVSGMSCKKIKDIYPEMGNDSMLRSNVSGCAWWHAWEGDENGSGYIVAMDGGGRNIAPHEAMHLMGIDDIERDGYLVNTDLYDCNDLMAYGCHSRVALSNVEMYLILKSIENDFEFYPWSDVEEEVARLVERNGLQY